MITLSVRGERSPASPIRRLTPFADEARSRGITVHQLNIGQPDIDTPKGMLDAYRALDDSVIAYAPSDGFLDYREKLAAYYGPVVGQARPVSPDDIVGMFVEETLGCCIRLILPIGAMKFSNQTDSLVIGSHDRCP